MNIQNNFYMSIGYPIGLCELDDGNRVFNVELNGSFIGLSLSSYNLWKFCFLDVKDKNSIIKEYGNEILSSLDDLIENKLIIELDFSEVDNVFNKLKILTPIKNGFGVGINEEGTSATILNQGTPFSISIEQFCFWAECDNRKLIKNMTEKISEKNKISEKQAKINVINYIMNLKTLDLIRLNKREKKGVN